jgi:hypothetical protein
LTILLPIFPVMDLFLRKIKWWTGDCCSLDRWCSGKYRKNKHKPNEPLHFRCKYLLPKPKYSIYGPSCKMIGPCSRPRDTYSNSAAT